MKRLNRVFNATAALLAMLIPMVAKAALPAAVSGAWYNPEQSGHGVTVEVLDPARALMFWHTYDHSGAPLTLYIEGAIHGRRINGVAYAPRGMRFGEFDPGDLQLPIWGEVDVEFQDCGHARLSWRPRDAAYSAGGLAMVRLAGIDGQTCELPSPTSVAPGLYEGAFDAAPSLAPTATGLGVVDREGRLWALERFRVDSAGAVGEVPGPSYVYADDNRLRWTPLVLLGTPLADDANTMRISESCNGGLVDVFYVWCGGSKRNGHWSINEIDVEPPVSQYSRNQRWVRGSGAEILLQDLSLEQLAGDYQVPFDTRFDPQPGRLDIDTDGQFCLRTSSDNECDYQGRVYLPDGADGFIDFELSRRSGHLVREVRGRGWTTMGPAGRTLYLVGEGLGLIAH